MQLRASHSDCVADFIQVSLDFIGEPRRDVFAGKNNKSLRDTLEHGKYSKLKSEACNLCGDSLDAPLGETLLMLKVTGSLFYRRFLNAYGDLTYSEFSIPTSSVRACIGVYAWVVADSVMYIGRCRDRTLGVRINQGYGKIHPKNCYLDGQSTNCRLNAEITQVRSSVQLWFCPLESSDVVEETERDLIRTHVPPWNIQRC